MIDSQLLLIVLALILSVLITRRISRPGSVFSALDLPNERSLHDRPTPSGGGVAIFTAIYLCLLFAGLSRAVVFGPEIIWLAGGGLLVGIVSYIDDRKGLPAWVRMVVHVAAAVLLVVAGFCPTFDPGSSSLGIMLPMAIRIACLVYIVWLINLYNFMDGMDGFAGGMAVFGFAFLAYFGWIRGAESFVLICLLLVAASLGFLLYNFPPARIFMGDVGSAPLGFMVAGLSLWGTRDRLFPFWVPVLIFSPFIVDATVTLSRRIFRGERIWEAHCSHYYQRLVRSGWGHKKTVLAEYALMIAAGLSAVLLEHFAKGIFVVMGLTGWTLAYVGAACVISMLERATSVTGHHQGR